MKQATDYGFPNPLAVEMFAWDCELAAQFQAESGSIVVKGGTATQMQLPIEMQRGSIDVDLVAPLAEYDITRISGKIEESLPNVKFDPIVPKKPIPKLPMVAYWVYVPASMEYMGKASLQIKADILLEDLKLPTTDLKGIKTFAIDVNGAKCYTKPVLVGDKLLTLARGSIGMHLDSDYPKQMYDIDMLFKAQVLGVDALKETIMTIQKLSEVEAGYRDLKNDEIKFLDDVAAIMTDYAKVDTAYGDEAIKNNIVKFQEPYVSEKQKLRLFGWSVRALRIRFLARLMQSVIAGSLTLNETFRILNSVNSIAEELKAIEGKDAITGLRDKLLALLKVRLPYFKELRGKPLERVFWEVVNINNIGEIETLQK